MALVPVLDRAPFSGACLADATWAARALEAGCQGESTDVYDWVDLVAAIAGVSHNSTDMVIRGELLIIDCASLLRKEYPKQYQAAASRRIHFI